MKLENIKEIIKHNTDGVLDGGNFKPDHLIQMTFGVVPHTFKSSLTYDTKILEIFEKDYELVTQSHRIDSDKKLSVREKHFIKFQNEGAICLTLSTNTEVQWPKGKGNISSDKIDEILENPKILGSVGIMVTYDSSNESEVFELMESLNQYEYKNEDVTMSQIYLVSQDRNGFDLEEFDINNPELELESNYGSEFVPVSEKIVEELNKNNNRGLVLLHGEPGTGKTTYIKWLVSQIKDKNVIFVPPFLTEAITSPEFIPFLAQNSNSVLVIEDAERVVSERGNGGSAVGVSNILNMTDGIMGDIMKIQIICSFNMNRNKIDSALLRKGRLIAEHKFDALDIEHSNKLLSKLGSKSTTDKPLTLAQIYNIDEEEYLAPSTKKIGF
jgi:SpoVK/Ycf46/Vps4 family AAA+-type ATPase